MKKITTTIILSFILYFCLATFSAFSALAAPAIPLTAAVYGPTSQQAPIMLAFNGYVSHKYNIKVQSKIPVYCHVYAAVSGHKLVYLGQTRTETSTLTVYTSATEILACYPVSAGMTANVFVVVK